MAKPSNPVNYFVSGTDYEPLTYEGGDKLYYAKLREESFGGCGYLHASLLIPANSIEHVREIIKRIVEHKLKCAEKYREIKGEDSSGYLRSIKRVEKLKSLEDHWEIEEAPKDQVFKVSWAWNDIF